MSINKVVISGNLTRDSELRAAQSGTSILTFGMAVNDRRRNPQTQEWEDYANFVDCVLFGNRAEYLSRILRKGIKVVVEGKLRYSSWERDGQRRSKLEVVVDDVDFVSPRQQQGGFSQSQQQGGSNQQQNNYSQRQDNYSQQQNNYSQRQDNYSQQQNNYSQRQDNYSQSQGYDQQQAPLYSAPAPTQSSQRYAQPKPQPQGEPNRNMVPDERPQQPAVSASPAPASTGDAVSMPAEPGVYDSDIPF